MGQRSQLCQLPFAYQRMCYIIAIGVRPVIVWGWNSPNDSTIFGPKRTSHIIAAVSPGGATWGWNPAKIPRYGDLWWIVEHVSNRVRRQRPRVGAMRAFKMKYVSNRVQRECPQLGAMWAFTKGWVCVRWPSIPLHVYMPVIDITIMKHHLSSITSIRVVQQKHHRSTVCLYDYNF
jgi:hypothetical protein